MNWAAAAAESPPPTTVNPLHSATAWATVRVPASKRGSSNTPIGPYSGGIFSDVIAEARTVFWNGPMGVFEDLRFEAGTRTVAIAVAECSGFTVVGGGDSAAAAKQFKLDREIDHVSTGGGASLELLEQGDLPGLEALRKASNAPQ